MFADMLHSWGEFCLDIRSVSSPYVFNDTVKVVNVFCMKSIFLNFDFDARIYLIYFVFGMYELSSNFGAGRRALFN